MVEELPAFDRPISQETGPRTSNAAELPEAVGGRQGISVQYVGEIRLP
jgi:hypothetical protein